MKCNGCEYNYDYVIDNYCSNCLDIKDALIVVIKNYVRCFDKILKDL
jgi:hypothetical protein